MEKNPNNWLPSLRMGDGAALRWKQYGIKEAFEGQTQHQMILG